MNDAEIRKNFHRKKLKRHHEDKDTLVVDELGLQHGAIRADIAVVNGHLIGFEIKSDRDGLSRLGGQIAGYGAVFDRVTILAGERHIAEVCRMVPKWWGITRCTRGPRGAVHFVTERRAFANPEVDLLSVARLLWRSELVKVLEQLGEDSRTLRKPRRVLYRRLVERLSSKELKHTVREFLKNRKNWRCQVQPSQCGG